ncbi:MAG: hypothetical protein NTV48_02115 [Candidatus Vogelbacteria bacterium]|nr:hypothetical protein [Candidatus Vogelbacteria bacterium]
MKNFKKSYLVSFLLLIPFNLLLAAGTGGGGYLSNPLKDDINTLPALLTLILSIVVTVGVPLVTLAIIYAGFLYVFARGDKGQLETARKAIMSAVIGATIVLGAYVIAGLIENTIKQVTGAPAAYIINQVDA